MSRTFGADGAKTERCAVGRATDNADVGVARRAASRAEFGDLAIDFLNFKFALFIRYFDDN